MYSRASSVTSVVCLIAEKWMLVLWVEEGLRSVLKVSRCVEPPPSALVNGTAAKVKFTDGKVYPAKVLGIGKFL